MCFFSKGSNFRKFCDLKKNYIRGILVPVKKVPSENKSPVKNDARVISLLRVCKQNKVSAAEVKWTQRK